MAQLPSPGLDRLEDAEAGLAGGVVDHVGAPSYMPSAAVLPPVGSRSALASVGPGRGRWCRP